MELPVWLMWVIAITLASMPLSVLAMSKLVKDGEDGVSNVRETLAYDIQDTLSDTEILVLTRLIARNQMRQYWPDERSPNIA